MDSERKLNLLFTKEDPSQILIKLRNAFPDRVSSAYVLAAGSSDFFPRHGQWMFSAAVGIVLFAIAIVHSWRRKPNPPMITISGGAFLMGSDDSSFEGARPVHEVQVAAFQMDKLEVTVRAYQACVRSGACSPPGSGGQCNWEVPGREDHPINCVSCAQAARFCSWLDRRLPTEQEWEYAARGKSGRTYPWGADEPDDHTCSKSYQETCPVGSYSRGATPEGVLDMAGNVREWVDGSYRECYDERCAPHLEARISRGGAAVDGLDWYHGVHRSWERQAWGPQLGFRCCK